MISFGGFIARLASTVGAGLVGRGASTVDADLTQIETDITALQSDKAPLESPALTGTPTVPTAAADTNTAQAASTAFVLTQIAQEIAGLVDSSPATLDTLNELAAALGDDPNFATTVTNSIALKAPLASPALTGTPTAPTAAGGTDTTQIATCAFAKAEAASAAVSAASQSEMEAASETSKYVSPSNIKWSPLAAKVVLVANTGGTIRYSENVTSITDLGTGMLLITFDVDFADTYYVVADTPYVTNIAYTTYVKTQAVGSVTIEGGSTGGYNDPVQWGVVIFGDQA